MNKNNINVELHNIKQKNKDDPELHPESIKHMFKVFEKYMNYSKIKDLYMAVIQEEGRKYESNEGRIEENT